MYAIVRAGGRQEKVEVGDVLVVDRMAGEPGASVQLPAVLLVDGASVTTDKATLGKVKVRHVSIGYQEPARLDDRLAISCAVKSLRRTRVIFEQEARRQSDGALLVHAEVEVVAVTMDTLKPRAMPETLMTTLTRKIEKTDV